MHEIDQALDAPKRARGRPRKFEAAEALEKMRRVFAAKGYAEASLDDLSAACGLNRPSIYAAFGDKEQLYLHALDAYGGAFVCVLEESLRQPGPIEERLTCFFEKAAAIYGAPPDRAGCMLAAAAGAAHHPRIAEATRRWRERIAHALETAFARATDEKALPPEPGPRLRAELMAAMLDSLSIRARLGASFGELAALAQDSLALICKVD